MYEQCSVILWLLVSLVQAGFGSILDIMQWVRVCTFVTGNPFGN